MRLILRVLHYTKPYRHYVPQYLCFSVLAVVFGVVNYTFLIPLLNILFQKVEVHTVPKPDFSFSLQYIKELYYHYFYAIIVRYGMMWALVYTCAAIFCSLLLANVCRYLCARVVGRVRLNLLERLRTHVYHSVLHRDLAFHKNNRKGHLLSVMINDINEIDNGVINGLQSMIRDPLTICVYVSVLFYLSAALTVFTLFFFPLSGFILSLVLRKIKQHGHYSQQMLSQLLATMEETLGGIKIIKAFYVEKKFSEQFVNINWAFTRISKKMYYRREMASPLSEFLGVVILLVIVLYAGYLVLHVDESLSGSVFIAYIAIYSQMIGPLKNFANTLGSYKKSQKICEHFFHLLDGASHRTSNAGKIDKTDFLSDIRFEQVSFRYQDDWVLRDVSFRVRRGEQVALVGKSGSGKTTIADLILHLYTPQKGSILIDGVPIGSIRPGNWHKNVGFVGQDPILFNDTIARNIALADDHIDYDRVVEAAKIANAHEFIQLLPDKYDTFVGDRGDKLSGGQKQRITIARALYHNPPVLLLDEATASLDAQSEKAVQQAIERVMKGRTSIIIAHRLSTIIHADRIIVLQEGRIVEMGTHQALLEKNGIYSSLIHLQQI